MKLRRLELKDAQPMQECMNDDNVNHFMRIHSMSFTVESCERFIESTWSDEKNKHFAIADDNDEWVGTISLKDIDLVKKEAEYAIVTASKVHGTGISHEASREILRYAFKDLKLERVYLYLSTKNVRANRFYTKFGFHFDRTDKSLMEINGNKEDINWYSMSKEEYERL